MIKTATIKDLAIRIKQAERSGYGLSVLTGAGCSMPSIPGCKGVIEIIKNEFTDVVADCITGDYYDLIAKLSYDDQDKLFNNLLDISNAPINTTHLFLAQLFKYKKADCLLTTNFDPIAVKALSTVHSFPAIYDVPSIGQYIPSNTKYPAIFYLHGQSGGFFQMHDSSQIDNISLVVKEIVEAEAAHRPLIVVGYSGDDKMFNALTKVKRYGQNIYWVKYKNDTLNKDVEAFLGSRREAYLIEGYEAATFFQSLNIELGVNAPTLFSDPITFVEDTISMFDNNMKLDDKPLNYHEDISQKLNKLKLCDNRDESDEAKNEARNAWLNANYDLLDKLAQEAKKEKNEEVLKYIAYGYFDEGLEKFKAGLVKEAIDNYNKGLELVPDFPHSFAYYNRGIMKGQLGLKEEALEDISKALEIDPTNIDGICNSALIKLRLKRLEEALLDINKAIEIDSKNSVAYDLRGTIKAEMKRPHEALLDYNKAIELNPQNAEPHNNIGNLKYENGNYLESLSDYDKAIELNPTMGMYYCNRANANLNLGHLELARKDYLKSIELDSKYAQAYNGIGNIEFRNKNNPEALTYYNKAIESDPKDPALYNNRGFLFAKEGDYQNALYDLNIAVQIEPNNSNFYHSRGFAYAKAGKNEEAFSDFAKAIELNPKQYDSYFDRALLYQTLGKTEEATADMKKALELKPDLEIPDWYKPE